MTMHLAPLACVQVVLRCEPLTTSPSVKRARTDRSSAVRQSSARAQAALLPHVSFTISSFLDYSVPKFWSLPRASKRNFMSLLPRLASREPADLDRHYRSFNCRKALVAAVENDNLEMIEWLLHSYSPNVHLQQAMAKAAMNGNVPILMRLVRHHCRITGACKVPAAVGAIASTDDMQVLQWLSEYLHQGDTALHALASAAQGGHLDAVKYLHERFSIEIMSGHQPGRAIFAAVLNGHLEIAQFLYENGYRLDVVACLGLTSRKGHLATVQWLFPMLPPPSSDHAIGTSEMDIAAEAGHLEIVQWLNANGSRGCSNDAMVLAARNGHLKIVQWLHHHHKNVECSFAMMDMAAQGGHLAVLQWLHENRTEGCSSRAMDYAAANGRLDIVQWLHEKYDAVGCTTSAMDNAAQNGHLEVLQWLHAYRKETACSSRAMNGAAANGHFAIVQWLHANHGAVVHHGIDCAAQNGYLEIVVWLHAATHDANTSTPSCCTQTAMDGAAKNGHLEMIQWLHTNRSEGCTQNAMDFAAQNGHLAIVEWLHENRHEGCTTKAMDLAAASGHLEMVAWLHENRSEGCTVDAMAFAASKGQFDVLLFLHANRSEGCNAEVLVSAVCMEHIEIARWLCEKYPECVDMNVLRSFGSIMTPAVLEQLALEL